MEEETLPTPLEGGNEETPQDDNDDVFGDEPTTVDVKAIQEAIGREDVKTQEDVIKWAKNVTKYVGENEFSKKAKEYEEFKKATGKTPAEFLASQTPSPQGDDVRAKVDDLEANIQEPEIKFVMEEVKAIAKATGKSPLEVYKGNEKLQKLASDLAKEERNKNSVTPPSSRLRVGTKSVEELSDEEHKANFQEMKTKSLKKHGMA